MGRALLNLAVGSIMGRVDQQGGFSVYVYAPPREHRPPHVHVESIRGGEVTVKLGNEFIGPSLWQNHHMRPDDAREALRMVERNQERYIDEWRRLHGS